MAIRDSFLFLRRGTGTQGEETLEGNKGGQGSQTSWVERLYRRHPERL